MEFDPGFSNEASATKNAVNVEDVAICGGNHGEGCGCEMVYPIDWVIDEGSKWQATLRCPNCEDVRPAIIDEDLIEEFDELLDIGTDSLVLDLRNLTYANMATEINAFVGALRDDHILPEDF